MIAAKAEVGTEKDEEVSQPAEPKFSVAETFEN
jgi:hypothetical protein